MNVNLAHPRLADSAKNTGYTKKRYEIGLSIENLLNTKWNEFEAEEVTRLRNEPAPVDQMSFTQRTPFFAKLSGGVFLGG